MFIYCHAELSSKLLRLWVGPWWTSISLLGGIPTPPKNMKVSWDYYSQYMEKYKMFQTTNQV
jgi:hypothetical protein